MNDADGIQLAYLSKPYCENCEASWPGENGCELESNGTCQWGKEGRIKEGDAVTVVFHGAQKTLCHNATVLHLPTATGDSWIVRDIDSGYVHYISEGCTVSKLISDNPSFKPTAGTDDGKS